MPILKIYRGQKLGQALTEMVAPVRVTYEALDQPEPDTLEALADLMALTPHLSVTTIRSPDRAADRVIVQGQNEPKLLFDGAPLGTELAALVSAIIITGRGDSGLSAETRQALADVPAPVHLEIFTTPT